MRAYNFCAGPAALPTAVLEKAQAEMLDWQGKGLSIMEMSHRSKEDMGTATQVIDAQNMLSALKAETALNAYKYVMSLATLLQSHGSIHQFQTYLLQPNTRFIR